jgi:Pectate lyase superfamily protein
VAVFTPGAFTRAAVQTACNSAVSVGGGVVYCAAGTYVWDATPLSVHSSVQIIGDGYGNGTDGIGTLFKQQNGSNASAMVVFYTSNGTDANAHNSGLHRLRLDGNKANNSGTATKGFTQITNPLFNASTNDNASVGWDMHHHVTDVHIWYMKGNGMEANGRSENLYSRMFVRECDGHGYVATADSCFSQCVAGVNGLAGFYLAFNASIRLVGCKSWYSGQASVASPGFGAGFNIDGNTSGCITISGCEAQDNKGPGLYMNGSYSCTIQCSFDSNSCTGVGSFPAVLLNNSYGNIIDGACMDRQNTGQGQFGQATQTYALKLTGGSTGNMIRLTNRWLNNPSSVGAIDPGSTNTNNDLIVTKIVTATTTTTRVTMA